MIKHIRLATKDEIEKLRETSNYGPECAVFALEQGSEPDFAVVKKVVEVDPVYFSKSSNDIQKSRFIYALEERMAGAGIEQYFVNVKASDVRWQNVIKSWGAECISPEPELRFQRNLR